jgi:hypothetical protein
MRKIPSKLYEKPSAKRTSCAECCIKEKEGKAEKTTKQKKGKRMLFVTASRSVLRRITGPRLRKRLLFLLISAVGQFWNHLEQNLNCAGESGLPVLTETQRGNG